MNGRQRAIKILVNRGVPIEPNEPTETLIKQTVKKIRHRRANRVKRLLVECDLRRSSFDEHSW